MAEEVEVDTPTADTEVIVTEPESSEIEEFFVETECPLCAKNIATVNTVLAVMQQQAVTIKEQQTTITSLASMLTELNGGNPVVIPNFREPTPTIVIPLAANEHDEIKIEIPSESAVEIDLDAVESDSKISRSPASKSKSPGSTVEVLTSGVVHKLDLSTVKTRVRRLAKKPAQKKPVEEKPRRISWRGPQAGLKKASKKGTNDNELTGENRINGAFQNERTSATSKSLPICDPDVTTKIWIKGSAYERAPCPLIQCSHRKFAAKDLYYLRRHFQQVHKITHPNPHFIIQCPVETCGAEFEQSLREIRKHILAEHKDLLPSPPKKTINSIINNHNIQQFHDNDDDLREEEVE